MGRSSKRIGEIIVIANFLVFHVERWMERIGDSPGFRPEIQFKIGDGKDQSAFAPSF
jgi:hypothetical protein